MKVLYLVFGAQEQGVKKKILDKIFFIKNAGVNISLLFVVDVVDINDKESNRPYDLLGVNYSFAAFFSRLPLLWRLSVLLRQKITYATLSEYLHQRDYDLILMRYPISDFFLHQFMKRHSHQFRIVFEHNTVEESELRLRSRNSYWYGYLYWSEMKFARLVRKRASGLISVTREIEKWQSHLVNGKVPSVTISNGIDVSRTKLKITKRPREIWVINLLLLAGSEAPWHGVDILLNSLAACQNSNGIHCYVAGRIDAASTARARQMPNVTLLDHQSQEDLDALVEKCHIGVGSLALFRNNMAEGCTLKVREYWARGLPFIIGYDDTDLMGNPQMNPYFLKVNISDGLHGPAFDMNSVVSFAKAVLSIPNVHADMRSLAMRAIDYPMKVNGYLSFFKEVASMSEANVTHGKEANTSHKRE
jgi:glycosyltransferase involved in cell wall biosynthesis